jgi:hypothetical protein
VTVTAKGCVGIYARPATVFCRRRKLAILRCRERSGAVGGQRLLLPVPQTVPTAHLGGAITAINAVLCSCAIRGGRVGVRNATAGCLTRMSKSDWPSSSGHYCVAIGSIRENLMPLSYRSNRSPRAGRALFRCLIVGRSPQLLLCSHGTTIDEESM